MTRAKRILIVGGVAGGASAAARLRRLDEQAQIIIFERGEHVSFANCGLPYHIGGTIADRGRLLVQTPATLKKTMNIEARVRSEVVRVDRAGKQITVRDLNTGKEYNEAYDFLILSPGAEPFKPAISGTDLPGVYTLRSIADMDRIKKQLDEQKAGRAVIVGGGYIGLEMAEALAERKVRTALIEVNPQVMNTMDPEMVAPLHQELALHGIELHLGVSLTQIQPGLKAVLSDGTTIEADLVLLAIGVRPESALARQAGLEVGKRGGIVVKAQMQTSDPSIYAVGDAVEIEDFVTGQQTVIPLAGPANRQGRIAADNISGLGSSYARTQGTAICKVFNLAAAVTGINEKNLKREGIAYEKVYVHPSSHASYYPGAAPISLKLLFDPGSGRILGAQAVGSDGVDKRIDVLATAMRAGLTVNDLKDLELSYAPPYGSAKDPVNYAGFVACNAISGDMPLVHHDELNGKFLLDVRTPHEVQAGTIPGSTNVPLDQLRSRLNELPKDKEIAVFCQVGLRGYLACRILNQSGFKSRNLSGGYKTWSAAKAFQNPVQTCSEKPMNETKSGSKDKDISIDAQVIRKIDACGLQCPGPILQLKQAVDEIQAGQAVQIAATDPGFAADIKGWCGSTGSKLHSLTAGKGRYEAVIVKGQVEPVAKTAAVSKNKTLVVFSGDFDKAMAAFIIANGAASMGGQVTMFFTFWGLNLLRKPVSVPVHKTFIERMFGWMMPRGAEKTTLSKMNMAGMGTRMIKFIMKSKNVSPLSELVEKAKAAGVRMVACSMSMDLMGIKKEELIDGIEEGGVATYLNQAENAGVNLFI